MSGPSGSVNIPLADSNWFLDRYSDYFPCDEWP